MINFKFLPKMIKVVQYELSLPELFLWCFLVLFALGLERKKNSQFHWRLILSVLLVFYITVLRRPLGQFTIRLIPFQLVTLRTLYTDFLNVLLFFPFGYELTRRFPGLPQVVTICMGSVLSLIVECLQLVFARGIFETEDIICNTLGTLLGITVFRIFYSCHKRLMINHKHQ